jgi:hypothetical protein
VHDPVVVETAGLSATATDVHVEIGADGSARADFVARLEGAGHVVHSEERVTVWPVSSTPARLGFAGEFLLDATTGPIAAAGELSANHLTVRLGDDAAGMDVTVDRRDGRTRLHAAARDFPIAMVSPLGKALPLASSIEARPNARLSGAFELEHGDDVRAHLRGLEISGLDVTHRKIARSTLEVEPVSLDGDAWWQSPEAFDVQVTLGHGALVVHGTVSRRSDSVRASVELPTTSCQAILDSLPAAMVHSVDGARLEGELDGRISATISMEALARIRALDPSEVDPLDPPRPGTLEVDFDVLGRCRVVADAVELDLEALRGPYRHRFVDGRGATRERTMAPGAPGYVPLSEVRHVADAFIVLEDARFFEHDGFDREQIENAWWHNLVVGRISRGASTISQQTARNLFLGIDRSVARKIQEAFVTSRLEATIPKARILELYLNVIELAPGIHGVQDAAQFHFGKSARDLSVLQAIHLAALAPAPHTYAERFADGNVDDPWMSDLRQHARRMHLHRKIDRTTLQRALVSPLHLRDRSQGGE